MSLSVNETTVEVTVVDSKVAVNVIDNPVNIEIAGTGVQGARGTQLITGNVPPSASTGMEGDQYINTATGFLYGPKTGSSWGTPTQLGNGAGVTKLGFTLGNGVTKTYSIAHGLGSTDVFCTVIEVATGDIVWPAISVDATHAYISFDEPPALNSYRAVIA